MYPRLGADLMEVYKSLASMAGIEESQKVDMRVHKYHEGLAEQGKGKVDKQVVVFHNDRKVEVEVCYQGHRFESFIDLFPMLEQDGERGVEEISAGDILVGDEPLKEVMVELKAAIASAGPSCIDYDSLFGSNL